MRTVLTAKQQKEVLRLYPNNFAQDIADKFKCNVSTIYNLANSRGVKKSEEWQRQELQRQAERLQKEGKRHRFPKGHEPANKGKKMDMEVYNKCKQTMFGEGHLPHNTNPIGSERVCKDGYIQVKYMNHKWRGKHILIWEEHNPPLKKGEMIKFKDGNKRNFDLDNLYLATRSDNMKMNTIHRFPVELKQTIRLVNKLKRNIDNKK